jgi:hypothetical protein
VVIWPTGTFFIHVHSHENSLAVVKTVSEKMILKKDSRAILVNAPDDSVKAMKLPSLEVASRLSGKFDYMHLFVTTQKELDRQFLRLKKYLAPKGSLWISWPKSRKLDSDLNIKSVIRIGYDHGLVESKALSIDETWSALKFTHPKEGKVYNNSYGKLNVR